MFLLALVLSTAMGVTLGLLGGGGSILTVPILLYVVGLSTKEAISTSLLIVAATSAAGTVLHARASNVEWRRGLVFGAVAMVGAWGGGRLAAFIPGRVLLLLFVAMMLATALAMLLRRGEPKPTESARGGHLPWGWIAAQGILVGGFTGLVGAGGGFLVVPALVLLGGLDMRRAVGTSLLVITMNSVAGFLGHGAATEWSLALPLAGVAVLGSLVGVRASGRVPQPTLRKIFAYFVLAIAAFILYRELGAAQVATLFLG
jgi:uncharacterized membrane protein YfcA